MAPIDPEDFVGHYVRRAQQTHQALWQAVVGNDLTSVQFGVLNFLARFPDSSQQSISDGLQIDRSTLAAVIARLENRGLVERERTERDARLKLVSLTPDGNEILERLIPLANEANTRLAGALSESEGQQLRQLLKKLLEAGHDESLRSG